MPIEWKTEGVATVFANQMIVQGGDDEIYLSFFEIIPPSLRLEDLADEQTARNKLGGKIPAQCVARVVVNPERLGDFVETMQATLAKWRARQDLADERSKP